MHYLQSDTLSKLWTKLFAERISSYYISCLPELLTISFHYNITRMKSTDVSDTSNSYVLLRNVLKCQVNLNAQCFLFIKIAISLRNEDNVLRPEYNLPMSVRLVNAA